LFSVFCKFARAVRIYHHEQKPKPKMKYRLILPIITALAGCATTPQRIIAMFAAVCGLFTLAVCAITECVSQESLLTSAGFRARTPLTPKQKSVYAAMPSYEICHETKAGKTTYGYKDEKAGVVYIGNEAQYQQYRQAAVEAQLKTLERQFRHQQIAQALQEQQTSNHLNSLKLSQNLMAIRQMQPPPPMPQFYRPVYTQAPPPMMPTPMWR